MRSDDGSNVIARETPTRCVGEKMSATLNGVIGPVRLFQGRKDIISSPGRCPRLLYWTRSASYLYRELTRLESLLNICEKLFGIRSVDDSVIKTQREVCHLADGNVIFAVGRGQHLGPLLDLPNAENCHLRLVNDRRAKQAAKNAGVSNGEGAAANFVRLQLFRTRAIGQIIRCPGQARDREIIRTFNYRND